MTEEDESLQETYQSLHEDIDKEQVYPVLSEIILPNSGESIDDLLVFAFCEFDAKKEEWSPKQKKQIAKLFAETLSD